MFPAYVGMSPAPTPPGCSAICVPRIRGDEPVVQLKKLLVEVCSPHTWG